MRLRTVIVIASLAIYSLFLYKIFPNALYSYWNFELSEMLPEYIKCANTKNDTNRFLGQCVLNITSLIEKNTSEIHVEWTRYELYKMFSKSMQFMHIAVIVSAVFSLVVEYLLGKEVQLHDLQMKHIEEKISYKKNVLTEYEKDIEKLKKDAEMFKQIANSEILATLDKESTSFAQNLMHHEVKKCYLLANYDRNLDIINSVVMLLKCHDRNITLIFKKQKKEANRYEAICYYNNVRITITENDESVIQADKHLMSSEQLSEILDVVNSIKQDAVMFKNEHVQCLIDHMYAKYEEHIII